MKYHIEGMGIIGCAIAHALYSVDVPFTWNDNGQKVAAWPASTGCIFPAEDWRSEYSYNQWAAATPSWAAVHMSVANYWYCTKSAPHGMKAKPVEQVGVLKRHPKGSMHFNAQTFVPYTRWLFAKQQRDAVEESDVLLIAHGFNSRLERYVWGWMRPVLLDTSELGGFASCLYMRRGRFVMAYAYPIPGTGMHYAGSTLLVQKEAQSRDASADYERWKRNFLELSEGRIKILDESAPIIEGWRPSSGPVEDEAGKALWVNTHTQATPYRQEIYTVLPLWHSGIRWLPSVIQELGTALNINFAEGGSFGYQPTRHIG